jgi:hypothetical protein
MLMQDGSMRAMKGVAHLVLVLGMIVGGVSLFGCAGDPPKPQAQPTYKDVRGDSDRFYDKLKQEERERGDKGTEGPGP